LIYYQRNTTTAMIGFNAAHKNKDMDIDIDIFIMRHEHSFVILDISCGHINMFGPMAIDELDSFLIIMRNEYDTTPLANPIEAWHTYTSAGEMKISHYPISVRHYLQIGCFDIPHPKYLFTPFLL
jgi:hypothetical protein